MSDASENGVMNCGPLVFSGALSEQTLRTANEALELTFDRQIYSANKTSGWIDNIGNYIISRLTKYAPAFKFIVSITISQKTGTGIHCESLAHWDASTDGAITSKYENESIRAICTVIGVAL